MQKKKMSRDELIEKVVPGVDDLRVIEINSVDLSNEDLSGIEFRNVAFIKCNFNSTNFTDCRFNSVIVFGCDCTKAIFKNVEAGMDFDGGTSLVGVNFDGSRFYDVCFYNCDVTDISLNEIKMFEISVPYPKSIKGRETFPYRCPSEGEFIGWKKCNYLGEYGRMQCVVQLLIPEDAKRSSAFSNKCRCDKAKVIGVYDCRHDEITGRVKVCSYHDLKFVYQVGKTVYPDSFDENRWNECSHGIHFFMSFEEAKDYYY